jgi:3-methyladenine DNA glycosylase/8-oxoguanine DNA glycosylase
MDPVTAALLGILMLLGGGVVWVTMMLRSWLERRAPQIEGPDAEKLREVMDDYRQLEGRLSQLEDEVGFLRQLKEPEPKSRLRPPTLHEDG